MTRAGVIAGLALLLAGCGSNGAGAPAAATGGSGGRGGSGAGGTAGAGGQPGAGACQLQAIPSASAGMVSWRDNGTPVCALVAITVRTVATLADTISIDATTADGRGIDVALSAYPGPLGGTYGCQTGNGTTQPNVMLEILGQRTSGFSPMSDCTITIGFTNDSAGVQHAQGTFSGTVTGDGGTDTITEGAFDVTVTLLGG
jgi:hypothetical protein